MLEALKTFVLPPELIKNSSLFPLISANYFISNFFLFLISTNSHPSTHNKSYNILSFFIISSPLFCALSQLLFPLKRRLEGGKNLFLFSQICRYLFTFLFYPFLDVFNVAWYNKKIFFEKKVRPGQQ